MSEVLLARVIGQGASLALLLVSAVVAAGIVRWIVRQPVRWRWLGLVALALAANGTILSVGKALQQSWPPTAGLDWNWLGKIVAVGVTLALIRFAPGISFAEAGLTLRQRVGSTGPALVAIGLMTVVSLGLNLSEPGPESVGVERILFQAAMPSFDEETFYRGLLFVLLARTFDDRWTVFGAPAGPALLFNALLFGAAHAVSFHDGGYAFAWQPFLFTGLFGLVAAWIRAHTGSMALPFAMHSIVNLLASVV